MCVEIQPSSDCQRRRRCGLSQCPPGCAMIWPETISPSLRHAARGGHDGRVMPGAALAGRTGSPLPGGMGGEVSMQESPEKSADVAGPADERRPEYNELIISYMFLRKTVGWIGSLLPVVLIASSLFYTTRPYSMSGYYYTHMRNL